MNLSSPRGRTATVLAGLLGLLALGFAVRSVRADPPSDLAPFINSCQNFNHMKAELTVRAGTNARVLPLLVEAQSTWMIVDLLWGTRNRYGWKDGAFTIHNRSKSQPGPAADVPLVIVSNLWGACRGGFPGATWTVRRPDQDGFPHKYAALSWFKGDLPYPWADNRDFYVGVNTDSKVVNEVVWHKQSTSDWGQLHVADVNWSVAGSSTFTRLAPDNEIQRPPRFRHIE